MAEVDDKIFLQPLNDENLIKLCVGQVTNASDYNLAVKEHPPVIGGLFDHTIFGCIRKCYCGRTTGTGTCPACGAKVVSREEASDRSGYYLLTYPYISKLKVKKFIDEITDFHPVFEKYKVGPGGKGTSSQTNLLANVYRYKIQYIPVERDEVNEDDLFVTDSNGIYKVDLVEYSDESGDESVEDYGPSALKRLCEKYQLYHTVSKSLSFVSNYVNQVVVVPPITVRPATVQQNLKGAWEIRSHALNGFYRALILADQALPKIFERLTTLADKLAVYFAINKMVNLLQDQFSIAAASKENLIRNKLVTLVKKSGRANIIGKPDAPIDEVYVPRSMAYECLKSNIINELKLRGVTNPVEEYTNPSPETLKIFEEIVKNSCVLFLRNPTLHRYNISAFKPKLWDQISIGMSLTSTRLFNADFDGDQMALFFLTDPQLATETLDRMGANRNWEFEKNNSPIFAPSVSILQGLYSATVVTKYDKKLQYFNTKEELFKAYEKNNSVEVDETVDLYGQRTTYGRTKVSDIIGTDLDNLVGKDKPINAKTIGLVMKALSVLDDKVDRLKRLQDLALETITYVGNTTISLEDIFQTDPAFPEMNKILNSKVEDSVKYRKLNEILPDIMEKQVRENFKNHNLVNIIDGSGKVKKANLPPLFGPRIEYTPEKGCVVYDDSIAQGFDEGGHVSHAIENREILKVKQEAVPTSGYFSRQLASLNYDIIFTEEPSVSKAGIVSKAKYVQGRIKIDGSPVNETGDTLVRVKSCVDGAPDRVSREELSSIPYAFKGYQEGDAIGISFATSISEEWVQSALGLKHGGALSVPSSEKLISLTAGKVTKITPDYITVKSGSASYDYPIPEKVLFTEYARGKEFKAGETLLYLDEMVRAEYKMEAVFALTEAYSDMDKVKKRDIKRAICYAPCDGVITYHITDQAKTSFVDVGGIKFPYLRNIVYKYPNGSHVKKGERISTGVVLLKEFNSLVNGDLGWTFYVFKDQIETIMGNTSINSELYEVTFKGLIGGQFSVRKTHKNMGKLLNEINLGNAKQAITKYIGEEIGSGLLTRLMLDTL